MSNTLGLPFAWREKWTLINITGKTTEKNPSCGYDEILSLVTKSIGHNVTLPGELIVEILCKLPVKSLIRFKTVCKSWKLLINFHVFIYRPNPQLGVYSLDFEGDIFPYPMDYIVGACNGIICIRTLGVQEPILLFNPSTREFSLVPRDLCGQDDHRGFFYLPKTQEYQILSVHEDYRKRLVDIATLTLGKIPYLRVAKNISMPGMIESDWKATYGTTAYLLGMNFDDDNEIVICYDVIEGRFSKMNMPPCSKMESKSLAMFKGSVIMFVSQWNLRFFDIWMLIDDMSNGKSWVKYRKVVPRVGFVCRLDGCLYDRWILSYIICNKEVLLHRKMKKKLVYYDLETGQVEDYFDFHGVTEHHKKWQQFTGEYVNYVESLVSIGSLVP